MLRAPSWAFLCLLAAADGLLGCETTCDKAEDTGPVVWAGGRTTGCTHYETNAFGEDYVHFPAGRRVRVPHGLGQVPQEVHSYLAFVKTPLPAASLGDTAESAGNQVIIEAVTDEYVQVHNETCEEFYLRLVLEAPEPSAGCGGGGAGGAGTAGADGSQAGSGP